MDGLTVSMLVVAMLVAMGLVLSEMRSALRPAMCPDCPHCRDRLAAEQRRQAELNAAHELRWGMYDREDEHPPRPRD